MSNYRELTLLAAVAVALLFGYAGVMLLAAWRGWTLCRAFGHDPKTQAGDWIDCEIAVVCRRCDKKLGVYK